MRNALWLFYGEQISRQWKLSQEATVQAKGGRGSSGDSVGEEKRMAARLGEVKSVLERGWARG